MSGGELQRVAIALCLGKPADVYLIDEPSAYLDSEQRLHAAKVIKRFILHAKKTGNLTLKLCFIKFCLSNTSFTTNMKKCQKRLLPIRFCF